MPNFLQPQWACVTEQLWNAVQKRITDNRVARQTSVHAAEPSLLAGLIYDHMGERMTPTHANKKGRRYRYYVSQSLIKRGRPKASDAARRVPAGDVERLVEERIVSFLKDEGALMGALTGTITEAHEIETLIAEASSLAKRWPRMPFVGGVSLMRTSLQSAVCW